MRTSDNGVKFITKHEGFRTVAYKDVVGKWTTGYGHLIRLPAEQYFVDTPVTPELAANLLKEDIKVAEQCITTNVRTTLTQEQYDALVSFIYNVGCAAFARSTLLFLLNKGEKERAAAQLLRWNKAGGEPVAGLTKRREEEMKLFMEGKYNA
jgi:lysozyme